MAFGVSFLFLLFILSQNSFASSISGVVYDKQSNALSDVDVELLDDLYRQRPDGRRKTDGAGRYQFDGLPDGYYTVRVMPFRYDLIDQSQSVEIVTMTVRGQGIGNGTFYADFYLLPKKGGLKDAELSVVFAQEVPKEAKAAYDQAVDDFSKKKVEEGFAGLKKSLEIFPTYYLALHRYGLELFARKQYLEAAGVLMEAIKVNEKNPTDFYYMGLAFFNLGEKYRKAAYSATNQAFILAPGSPQVLLLIGQIERLSGKFPEAEKHLLQAKKLSTSQNPDIHWELALLFGKDLQRYKEAADELELYLKVSKVSGEKEKQTRKLIADFRNKANNPTTN